MKLARRIEWHYHRQVLPEFSQQSEGQGSGKPNALPTSWINVFVDSHRYFRHDPISFALEMMEPANPGDFLQSCVEPHVDLVANCSRMAEIADPWTCRAPSSAIDL
jgi:hypothetical protein